MRIYLTLAGLSAAVFAITKLVKSSDSNICANLQVNGTTRARFS